MAAQTPVNRTGAQMLTISCVEGEVILGVDTHRDTHAAVLIDPLGRLLATETFATTRRGHRAMIAWAQLRGTVRRAGVEGTGSFGAGLTRTLRLEGIEVIEVTRATRVGGPHPPQERPPRRRGPLPQRPLRPGDRRAEGP